MKLATYQYSNNISVNIVTGNGICPAPEEYNGHNGMIRFLIAGEPAINVLKDSINNNSVLLPFEEVQLLTPIARSEKFFGVALNYADHIKETGLEQPEYPALFNKQNSCVIRYW